MRATTLRLEAQISDPAGVQQVELLRAVLGAGNADLLRDSLQLMDWCVAQVREGRQIASVPSSGAVRELSMPTLARARAPAMHHGKGDAYVSSAAYGSDSPRITVHWWGEVDSFYQVDVDCWPVFISRLR